VVEYRERALQCFIAFWSLAKNYWQEYVLSDATNAPKCEVGVPGKGMEVVGIEFPQSQARASEVILTQNP
jgi:hypothetical protein